MRKLIFAMLLMLLTSAPAGAASIADDETANDAIETAGIQIPNGSGPSASVGVLTLIPGDVDFVGVGPLVAGDVITAVATPLGGEFLVPDTIIGVFNAAGDRLDFNDDAGGIGFGSALGFEVSSDGDYFVGVSGFGDEAFMGFHSEDGRYALTVSVVPVPSSNTPPDCSAAVATPDNLWPVDRRLVDVSIAGVSDSDGDPVALAITSIFQDEPIANLRRRDTCRDGLGLGTDLASVRAESSGTGDGRVYSIGFSAMDGHGGECSGTVTVCVPRRQGRHAGCVDQGALFDSTDCNG